MTARRTDANHAEIRDSLRACGYQVIDLSAVGHGIPDLLVVSKTGQIVLIEVKAPKGRMTPAEDKFHAEFNGPLAVVRSVEAALQVMADLETGGN